LSTERLKVIYENSPNGRNIGFPCQGLNITGFSAQ